MAYTSRHEMQFEWDPVKDQINQSKHGVSFEVAAEFLATEVDCLEIYDAENSTVEDRFIAIGPNRVGMLVVVYTETRDDLTRILSARKASPKEARRYESYWQGKHE